MDKTTLALVIQGVLLPLLLFILTSIKSDVKRIDNKLDTFQTKDGCKVHHDAHDREHELENQNSEKERLRVEKDLNAIAEIARGGKR